MADLEREMQEQKAQKDLMDAAWKYGVVDTKGIHPILQEKATSHGQDYFKTLVEERAKTPQGSYLNPANVSWAQQNFTNNIGKLQSLSKIIPEQKQKYAEMEKSGKWDIQPTEAGQALIDWELTGDPEKRRFFVENYRGGELYTATPKYVMPTLDDIAKSVKDAVVESIEKGNKTEQTRPIGKDIVKQILSDERTMKGYGDFYGIDVSTPQGKEQVVDIVNKKVNPVSISFDEPKVANNFSLNLGANTPLSSIGLEANVPTGTGKMNNQGQRSTAVLKSTLAPVKDRQISAINIIPENEVTKAFLKNKQSVSGVTVNPPELVPVYKNGIKGHPIVNGKIVTTKIEDIGGTAVPDGKLESDKGTYEYKLRHPINWEADGMTYNAYTPFDANTASLFMQESQSDKPIIIANITKMKEEMDRLNESIKSVKPKTKVVEENKIIIKGKEYPESKVLEQAKKSGMTKEEYINALNSMK